MCQARWVLGLALLAVSVGLADSVNPSTVGTALYIAAGAGAARDLVHFILGVFTVSFVGGIVILAGPGQAILAAVARPSPRATHLLEVGLGGLALAVAVVLWLSRRAVERRVGLREGRAGRSSFTLGAAIMAVELPTAFAYFAVLAAAVGSGQTFASQVVAIVTFNVAFVAPLIAIACLHRLAGANAERRLAALRQRIDRHAAAIIVGVMVVLACALLLVGAIGLATQR